MRLDESADERVGDTMRLAGFNQAPDGFDAVKRVAPRGNIGGLPPKSEMVVVAGIHPEIERFPHTLRFKRLSRGETGQLRADMHLEAALRF